ncbi:MAG: MerR family transcriptional regulator [Acidobacteriota bacterium]
MVGVSLPLEIPKGTFFKAAEVCELVKVQPYVLRSWEGEFPELGVAKTAGGPRLYRRADIEQVMRIKHLLLVEGLTLAGARRKLQEELASAGPAVVEDFIGPVTRDRLSEIKRGLRSILDLLSPPQTDEEFSLHAPEAAPVSEAGSESEPDGGVPTRPSRASRNGSPERTAARKKRSA